jgi:hypothetical protein
MSEEQNDVYIYNPEETAAEEDLFNAAPANINAMHATGVWARLSKLDVADFVETKGDGRFQAAYISWSTAWALLMNEYPESTWQRLGVRKEEDGSVTVRTQVVVTDRGVHMAHDMELPVMDHKFQAILNPNARQISDAYFRCLVKNLALFGLGLDLWADTDGPVGEVHTPIDEDRLELIMGLLDKSETDVDRFMKWAGIDAVEELPNSKFRSARTFLERRLQQKGAKS